MNGFYAPFYKKGCFSQKVQPFLFRFRIIKKTKKMNYTKEQLNKLPKWAQRELSRLELLTKTLNQRISEFNGESETNAYLTEGFDERPLMNDAQIEFRTGEKQANKVSVCVSNGSVQVYANSRTGKDMIIRPVASNIFFIDFV